MSKSDKNNTKNLKYKILKTYPNYKIYENGIIIRIRDGYKMTQTWRSGYYRVSLTSNKKTMHFGVHVLVARVFIPNPEKLPCVDHIDENRKNNHYTNLQWITYPGNSQKHHDIPKEKKNVLQYTKNMVLVKEWTSVKEILKNKPKYKESTLINNLCGHQKNAYNFIWQYKIPRKKRISIKPEKGEVFKPIPKFGNHNISAYSASNKGHIMNKKGHIMTNKIDDNGYATLTLVNKITKKKNIYFVHKLVAYAFIKNDDPINKKVVNHIDHNNKNNNVENLEWATKQYDVIHAHGLKVNMIDPKTNKIVKNFDCIADANRYLGIYKTNKMINRICKGLTTNKIYHGYKWEYRDDDIDKITTEEILLADQN